MNYRVIKDVGVYIAGRHFAHGELIDPAKIVPPAPAVPKGAPADVVAAAKQTQEALAEQAKTEWAAILKSGNQVEDAKAAKPAEEA